MEKVILSRFLFSLQAEQYNAVTLRDPKTAMEAASILDDMVSRTEFARKHLRGSDRSDQQNHSYGRREYGRRGYHGYKSGRSSPTDKQPQNDNPSQPVTSSSEPKPQEPVGSGKVVSNPLPQNGTTNQGSVSSRQGKQRQIICHSCREPGHIKPNCPYRVRRLSPSEMDSGCDEDDEIEEADVAEPNCVDGSIGCKLIAGMRYDSGCDRTVVDKALVPLEAYIGQKVTLKGWRGRQTSTHEMAKIDITVGKVVHKMKKVAVAEGMEYPALLGADMSRAIKCEIMRRVMEEWESEGEVGHAKEVVSEAVRVTRAQAQKQKEAEQADDLASEESQCTPIPLSDVFDFGDEMFDNSIATPLAELDSSMVEAVPLTSHGDRGALQREQAADTTLTALHAFAKASEKGYRYDQGILVQDEEDCLGDLSSRIVVPQGRRVALLKLAHSGVASGHFGVKKSYAKLASHFTWPKMYVEMKELVRTCPGCQRAAKNMNARAPLMPLPCIGDPFKLVAMDIVGPIPRSASGYKYILTLMDLYTKYPEAIPLKKVDNEAVLEAFLEVISRHGIPETILTDQGSVFMSRLTKSVCNYLGIEQIRTSPYHPQSDGALERWHACLKGMLKRSEVDLKLWDRHLKYLLFAYRDTPHMVTGFSPFTLLFGREVKGPLSLVHSSWLDGESEGVEASGWLTALKEQMSLMSAVVTEREKLAKAKMKVAFDKHAKEKSFSVGEAVLVRRPGLQRKLGDSWDGPYQILEKISPLNYKVETPGRKSKVLHVNLLKKWSVPAARVHGVAVIKEEEGECESPQGLTLVMSDFVPTESQQQQLHETLQKFPEVLCDQPGKTEVVTLSILTGDASPISSHPYRIPPKWRSEVRAQIDQLLLLGIIEASESPWSSAVVTVKKKTGGCRICIDYRAVNGVTTPDPYQMPFIEDILDTLASAKHMSKIDLNKGFHQIPVRMEDKEKTAFCTPWGEYHFCRMPFGLRNGPAVFQRLMDKILHQDLEYCRVYIDDIVIFSQSWEQHCLHLCKVLERLRTAGLTANRSKCQWGKQRFEFLGHVVGVGLVSPSDCKISALKEFQQPRSKKGIRQFLGLAGYYRRFIKDYAAHSCALTDATRKSAPECVEWNDVMYDEFCYLQNILCDVPSLTLPTIQDDFIVQTDASGRGVGAILSVTRGGQELPVAYFSRKLKPREVKYSATELEGLAVVNAVQHFDVYLVTHPFVVVTDHRALVFLNSTRHANGRLARWALALQPYTFTLKYRAGHLNHNADALSRCHDEENGESDGCQRPPEEGGGVRPRANTDRVRGRATGRATAEAEPEQRQSH